MSNIKTFAILGGDKRQLFLADSLVRDGYSVIMGGFDNLLSIGEITMADVKTAITYCDAAIFPLPSVRTDGSLNTPFSDKSIFLSDREQRILLEKPIFAAMSDKLLKAYPTLKSADVYDYAARNDFAILNAVPTAEGAIEAAMKSFEGTISGSKTMVVGFGRIGKVLARALKSLDSEVTVCARSAGDLAYIKALGYRAQKTERLHVVSGYDIVFNTVPALIFDEELLKNTERNTLIIDLASLPGGVDFEAAKALGIDAQRALSLPGKCSPKSAGEIIKNTVLNMMN